MNLRSCPCEIELRDLITRGQWPQAASPDLRAHIAACRSCGDVALVSAAFQKARAESIAAARPGSAGALWWRAQLRRRNAVVERISRPLLGAQLFALAVSLLAGLGFLGFEARNGVAWLTWLQQLPQTAALHWDELRSTGALDQSWNWMVLLPAVATLALLTGVAIYMATDRQ
ncbi:MAG: hypothetical protein WBC92_09785 [Terracidiphilus sp.]